MVKALLSSYDYATGELSCTASTWQPPQKLAKNERDALQKFVAQSESALGPIAETDLRKWLGTLATLCAGNISVHDARLKMAALVEMLQVFPQAVFTRETLDEIARKSKWLPSYAEICDVLEPKRCEMLALQSRAKQTLALPQPKPRPDWKSLPRERWDAQHWADYVADAMAMRLLAEQNPTLLNPTDWHAICAERQREAASKGRGITVTPRNHAQPAHGASTPRMRLDRRRS